MKHTEKTRLLKQASLEQTIQDQKHRIKWLEEYCATLEQSLDTYMEIVNNAKE